MKTTKNKSVFFNLWINYKSENLHLVRQYGKLAFEYFVSERTHMIEVYQIQSVKDLFPQYF